MNPDSHKFVPTKYGPPPPPATNAVSNEGPLFDEIRRHQARERKELARALARIPSPATESAEPFSDGYQPVRSAGDIVPIEALEKPIGFDGDEEVREFRLVSCQGRMSVLPFELWVMEAVGGLCDGATFQCYVRFESK